ncbi:hypothetical protein [Deinococcus soli (ex Cha et al. 2016)]|uniref:Uncharacterized protein n=2 Tax=Deinococcus soli (ex Cha et al. 2016) TaxID=1309411 RepID=A0ACC6KMW0_9DEIO|nr:hypothetical protein [Deinococcus soli (ex Cha et al. 2016)]MDR6220868.1 hypothetical protein [Deinococcus soli (ex Cha et al. 2016)]MDR6330862.1 hypothetical protein [Deinococcus soli (ex Cha et al. 2016)]MDR6753967.1 hypothetical protein [Deinococcus soli (ex Cha et al. 2016)]GGB84791.1 hypothetical protein GCM10008019_45960 [Deinococcus soli (ex Cha et al. 2016)]
MRPEQPLRQKQSYTPPRLERHRYTVVTGASFPVGTNGFPDPFTRELFNPKGDR